MKSFKRLILASILITICFVFIKPVSAEDNITSPYITINSPTVKKVYYKGENINYSVFAKNPWSAYWAHPWIGLINNSTTNIVYKQEFSTMGTGEYQTMKGSINTSNIATGSYGFAAVLAQTDRVSPYYPTGTTETAAKLIYVRTLKAPKSVKATGKYKKVVIRYKKAAGASKYYIYRSTKKTSGFKKIGATKKTVFTNKKVKRGKRYYYKIKSVRTVNQTIKSAYSARVTAKAK